MLKLAGFRHDGNSLNVTNKSPINTFAETRKYTQSINPSSYLLEVKYAHSLGAWQRLKVNGTPSSFSLHKVAPFDRFEGCRNVVVPYLFEQIDFYCANNTRHGCIVWFALERIEHDLADIEYQVEE